MRLLYSGTNLRPSRQIRPPIYSLKQTKLRKRRIVRFAILYFALFVIFLALIVGPIVAGPKIPKLSLGGGLVGDLVQPVGQNNNDTVSSYTGSGGNVGGAGGTPATATDGSGGDGSAATTSLADPFPSARKFMVI